MARYIEVEKAKKAVFWDEDAIKAIDDIQSADVVEVVRCKDCRHLEILNGQEYYARCKWHGRLFDSFGKADTRNWFCADGERREDGEIH